MTDTSKKVLLPDGREVTLRRPAAGEDLDRVVAFLTGLPPEIKNRLRYDVTDRAMAETRLSQIDDHDHWRLVAELDGRIVADGTMDREPYMWTRHVAQLRTIVDPKMERLGIRDMLVNRLVALGAKAGIERLYTEVLKSQADLIKILENEGFAYEATRKKYAKDLEGRLHDVVVMSNDLGAVWEQLRDRLEELDSQLSKNFFGE